MHFAQKHVRILPGRRNLSAPCAAGWDGNTYVQVLLASRFRVRAFKHEKSAALRVLFDHAFEFHH